MTRISRTASFAPDDPPLVILDDLACPACGRQDPRAFRCPISDNRLRLFCDGCGAFVTVLLSDEQALAIERQGRPASTW